MKTSQWGVAAVRGGGRSRGGRRHARSGTKQRLASNRVKNAPKIGDVLTRSTPRTDLPAIAVSGTFAKPTTRLIAVNDLQVAILKPHTKRYLHNLANPLKLRKLRTPPPKSKSR